MNLKLKFKGLSQRFDCIDEEKLKLPSEYDKALEGMCFYTGSYVYSVEKCLRVLQDHHKFSEEDAMDWFEFNIAGSQGQGYPVYNYTENLDILREIEMLLG
jgi:hypothetical protein